MTRRILIGLAVIALAGIAQAKPNFSGQWKLNKARSNYGQIPLPEKFDRKIIHLDPALQIQTTQSGFGGQGDEIVSQLKYTTDGKEVTNPMQGGEAKGTAKWEGDVLVIAASRSSANGDIKFLERWTLSADGKTLEIVTKGSGGFGEFELKTVLDKQ